MSLANYVIAIDFDGTCVKHEYPFIGEDIGAVPVLLELVNHDIKLILNTTRSGIYLDEAVKWFTKNNIPLYGVNNNPTQKEWTDSPKVYAQLYIDDAALGIPLIYPTSSVYYIRPYVNWSKIRELLVDRSILN